MLENRYDFNFDLKDVREVADMQVSHEHVYYC